MIIVLALALLCLIVQLYYWNFVFRKAASDIHSDVKQEEESPFLSVVVCFHQKWDLVPKVIRQLEQQSYRNFEVVLVNDGPVEINAHLLEKVLAENDHIRYITHSKTHPGKKGALATGIHAARSDWVLMTDMDCLPGPAWVATMAKSIPNYPAIILGFSPYQRSPGLLNFVIRQETLLTAFQYLGWARSGWPYMGVGRNMASHRYIYQAYPLENHQHIPTGDDDLFVNAAARQFPVKICNDPASFVFSDPPRTWKLWYRQKIRHKSGGKFYSFPSKMRLGLFMATLMLEKILWIVLAFESLKLFLLLFVLKILGTMAPLRDLYRRYSIESDFWKMWLYEWIHVAYLILMMPYIFFKSRKKWD